VPAALARVLPVLVALAALAAPLQAQGEVGLEKLTNGQDADVPPGPIVLAGSPVNWTYVVTNTGSRDLNLVSVTDDQGVVVTCPSTILPAGESMICTGNGTAQEGQYANLGMVTAELIDGTPVSDTDPSHYFGQAVASVTLEKQTNGFDADTPPGPSIPVGDPVTWTYEVTNTGSEPLSGIDVIDSEGVVVSCPGTDLAPGASMTCTGNGSAEPGQYANIGSVTASLPDESATGANDPSHYFGQVLTLEKATNGQDADVPPGPILAPGAAVTWTYEVTNPGPATVTNLVVTDDQLGPVACPQTTLAAGESVTCTANGTAQAGQYANVGTATADLPAGGSVSANDPSHYFGQVLSLEKATNGQDADLPPGPSVAVGSPVDWTYEVTNLDVAETLTNVTVTDDQGVTVTCPATTLAPGASMICTADGLAVAGQYSNEGIAAAEHPTLGEVEDRDSSHYFGQDLVLDFGDAADPTYFTLFTSDGARHLLGSTVYLGACVDSEADGQPGPGADADDLATGASVFGTCATAGEDEDGVAFTSQLVAGTTAEVEVVASSACTLSAWIDFNRDGDWTDTDEDLFPGGTALVAGSNPLSFGVPASAVTGVAASRFRCTTAGAVSFTGEAPDGEVEDYVVTLFTTPANGTATKTAALSGDQNGDGLVGPGDTLTYTVTLTNDGGADAFSVVFDDTPDPNTTLVAGSVTTTLGGVTLGNTAGDTAVQVDVGTLAGGGTATITFEVVVDDPLPDGVEEVANQGTVTGSNLPSILTDDPAAAGGADPTVSPLVVPAPGVPEIPTLFWWAQLGLALALGALALRWIAGK
jgi:uncharacterized repeat protein (TIGR01451 family)